MINLFFHLRRSRSSRIVYDWLIVTGAVINNFALFGRVIVFSSFPSPIMCLVGAFQLLPLAPPSPFNVKAIKN